MMKDSMLKKVELEQVTFTDLETEWLMDNIGNEDPIIRDNTVFILLANGIVEGGFTKKQFAYIKDKSITENLMLYKIEAGLPYTLTRSFSILLNGFIIQADGISTSPYYRSLSDMERNYFFELARKYLYEEKDLTSYSTKYGWVHSFGHFGDYLYKVISHELYDVEELNAILDGIYYVFKNLNKSFEFGEERRLGHAIYEGMLINKISQDTLTEWIQQIEFPLNENEDYYSVSAFENFLSYIYFQSMGKIELTESLKTSMLVHLKKYTLY